jgi:hypothetical protein
MIEDQIDRVTDYRDKLWQSIVRSIRLCLLQEESAGRLSDTSIDEPLVNELTITSRGGFISIWLRPETGNGSWNQLAPVDDCQPWHVWPNGDVEIDGTLMNSSAAGKWFVDRLSKE